MTTLTLFQIASEYRKITDVLMDTQSDDQAIADTLEAERWPLEVKAQNYGFLIRNLQANATAMKEAEENMARRRKAAENRAQYMLDRLKTGMEIAGVTKLDFPEFSISIKKNPASVDIFEPGLIPAEFMSTPLPPPLAPDKTAIKKAIADGQDVPGAKLVQATRLEVK